MDVISTSELDPASAAVLHVGKPNWKGEVDQLPDWSAFWRGGSWQSPSLRLDYFVAHNCSSRTGDLSST
jgi:hypothetical protein